jgi:hypothetical protein
MYDVMPTAVPVERSTTANGSIVPRSKSASRRAISSATLLGGGDAGVPELEEITVAGRGDEIVVMIGPERREHNGVAAQGDRRGPVHVTVAGERVSNRSGDAADGAS